MSIFSTCNFDILSESLKTVIGTHCYNTYEELTCVLFSFLPSSFTGIALTEESKEQSFFLFQKCSFWNNTSGFCCIDFNEFSLTTFLLKGATRH